MSKSWNIKNNRKLKLNEHSLLMGIINVTPDSFSDGGLAFNVKDATQKALSLEQDGADILDIGGESTRPGATPLTGEEERERILPIIKAIASKTNIPISVDTYRAKTAEKALFAGADIINDVFGLQKDSNMANIIAETGAGIIIMHTGRERIKNADILEDQRIFFTKSLDIAAKAGIKKEQIILDPGFGFAKNMSESLTLLKHAERLQDFGFPLLAGTSRKGFLGKITNINSPKERDIATSATSVILREKGFSLFRVHNISVNRQALEIADALKTIKQGSTKFS